MMAHKQYLTWLMTKSKHINATVLNTRPVTLQKSTHHAFVKQGFNVIDFPCIEIVSVNNVDKVFTQFNKLKAKDVIVFTSQYAVKHAFKINPKLLIPVKATVIAVGTKTSQILEQNYSGNIWIPKQQNSEGVIDLIQGLAKCESIKLISAENGRNVIQYFAENHRLKFEQFNVYQRKLPSINKQSFQTIEQTNSLYILATSVTTLNNLKILTSYLWSNILNQTVICASSRIQKVAQEFGFNKTLNCQSADPELMAEKLQSIVSSKHSSI